MHCQTHGVLQAHYPGEMPVGTVHISVHKSSLDQVDDHLTLASGELGVKSIVPSGILERGMEPSVVA